MKTKTGEYSLMINKNFVDIRKKKKEIMKKDLKFLVFC